MVSVNVLSIIPNIAPNKNTLSECRSIGRRCIIMQGLSSGRFTGSEAREHTIRRWNQGRREIKNTTQSKIKGLKAHCRDHSVKSTPEVKINRALISKTFDK